MGRLRHRMVDAPNSLGARSRRRRWATFAALFPQLPDMRVLDLGGTVEWWRRAADRPSHVTVVNLLEPGTPDLPWVTPLLGDACDPPPIVTEGTYDLVFSNSLIEHVGGHAKRTALAQVVRDSAPCHWVQTPYRYFPVEPHFLFPGFQFLPLAARARILQGWPLVHTKPQGRIGAINTAQWTELLSGTELRAYFPDSVVLHERVAGLTKSLIAYRTG